MFHVFLGKGLLLGALFFSSISCSVKKQEISNEAESEIPGWLSGEAEDYSGLCQVGFSGETLNPLNQRKVAYKDALNNLSLTLKARLKAALIDYQSKKLSIFKIEGETSQDPAVFNSLKEKAKIKSSYFDEKGLTRNRSLKTLYVLLCLPEQKPLRDLKLKHLCQTESSHYGKYFDYNDMFRKLTQKAREKLSFSFSAKVENYTVIHNQKFDSVTLQLADVVIKGSYVNKLWTDQKKAFAEVCLPYRTK